MSKIILSYIRGGRAIDDGYDELARFIHQLGYPLLDRDSLIAAIRELGFHATEGYASDSRITVERLCIICMKELGMETIIIHDSEAMARLSERIEMRLGHSRRAEGPDGMAKHIRNSLVQCGRGRYILPEKVILDEGLLDEIIGYINSDHAGRVDFNEIYARFEQKLRDSGSGIDNRYFLQLAVSFFHPRRYHMKRDYLIKDIRQ